MNIYSIMKMKRALILILMVLPAIALHAQNPNLEKLNAYKVGFFTKRLNLTASEAEKFWPVYNEYQNEKNKIQVERFAMIRNFNQNESSMSDEQLTRLGDRLVEAEVKEAELAMQFHGQLKVVLLPAKVIRFYQAENQYKAQLLNELQNRAVQNRQQQNRQLNRPPK